VHLVGFHYKDTRVIVTGSKHDVAHKSKRLILIVLC